MYGAATDSDMILWVGIAFNTLAHLMRAFIQVSRDELREVMKAIDDAMGRRIETSSEENMPTSIRPTTISTLKQQPVMTMVTDSVSC